VTSTPVDVATLLLRFGLGVIFLFSGMQKVLPGTGRTIAYFSELGIPWPELVGPLVSNLELFGALLLMAGLLTRLVGALFLSEMVAALLVVRLPIAAGSDSVADGVAALRLEWLIAIVAGCLVLLGGGRWSIDANVRRRQPANGPG
jgi:putative oxidoreductase